MYLIPNYVQRMTIHPLLTEDGGILAERMLNLKSSDNDIKKEYILGNNSKVQM